MTSDGHSARFTHSNKQVTAGKERCLTMSHRTIFSIIAFHCLESDTIQNGLIPLDSFESVGIEMLPLINVLSMCRN